MSALAQVIEAAGGPIPAAKACDVSRQAVDKWLANGHLPRTDFSGETTYAEKLAAASNGKFSAEWVRENARPSKSSA